MVKSLVVVESPIKAKTIEKYLGEDFKVMASYGHVRDLIPKEGAIDPNNHFKMHYQTITRNIHHINAITKVLKSCHSLYLATDPDREGEAIAWHIKQMLENQDSLKKKKCLRIVFHQITKKAIQQAMKNPRDISMNLVNAQQARRALDYLVGFYLSPLLWKKIRPGLSAGRVQSPALRLIVEREMEIKNFKSREYWTIHANCQIKKQCFDAHLIDFKGKKCDQFSIINAEQALKIRDTIDQVSNGKLTILKIVKRDRKKNPAPPFITSTMQQESVRTLGFSTSKTMQIAQQLYEGINLGEEGTIGLITYMRTDSFMFAPEALQEIRQLIKEKYGQENVPERMQIYKTKSKNAQEAHEAIRPTSVFRLPEKLKKHLSDDQLRLYTLIWKRTIACQMIKATLHTMTVDLKSSNAIFRVNSSNIKKLGFIAVYQKNYDENKKEKENSKVFPSLEEGNTVNISEIRSEQHFTEPPLRYTEASLVKTLEEYDIGRPSTYANIITTLKNRKYVDIDKKYFIATDVGLIVHRFLIHYFTKYIDYKFTAKLEDELDGIARGEKMWVPVLEAFWLPFKDLVDFTEKTVKRSDITQEKIDEKCLKCGAQLSIQFGKRGHFIGCTAYPNCDYTRNLTEKATENKSIIKGRKCPECQCNLIIKIGRYGKFIGCSKYPNCKYIESPKKPKDTKVVCPKCKKANILQRESRRRKIFYSCACYPNCDYALWNEPSSEACPNCGWPILLIKATKSRGTEKMCPQKTCNFIGTHLEKNTDE